MKRILPLLLAAWYQLARAVVVFEFTTQERAVRPGASFFLDVSPTAPLGTYSMNPGGPWVTWVSVDGDLIGETPFDELRGVATRPCSAS